MVISYVMIENELGIAHLLYMEWFRIVLLRPTRSPSREYREDIRLSPIAASLNDLLILKTSSDLVQMDRRNLQARPNDDRDRSMVGGDRRLPNSFA